MICAHVTVPAMLAGAVGRRLIVHQGDARCFYCGSPCGTKLPASEHVKSSFTGRAGVAAPGSPWICEGCGLCLRESCTIPMLAGGKRVGQRMRGYSWVITATEIGAATKSDIAILRTACLSPPEPPFAIVLSDSGQTHQLYRGRVNHVSLPVTVTLEAEPITYYPDRLREALNIAGHVAAACGKPSLSEPVSPNKAIAVIERFGTKAEPLIEEWSRTWSTGLGRLAAWLTPKKEACQHEYPEEA